MSMYSVRRGHGKEWQCRPNRAQGEERGARRIDQKPLLPPQPPFLSSQPQSYSQRFVPVCARLVESGQISQDLTLTSGPIVHSLMSEMSFRTCSQFLQDRRESNAAGHLLKSDFATRPLPPGIMLHG